MTRDTIVGLSVLVFLLISFAACVCIDCRNDRVNAGRQRATTGAFVDVPGNGRPTFPQGLSTLGWSINIATPSPTRVEYPRGVSGDEIERERLTLEWARKNGLVKP